MGAEKDICRLARQEHLAGSCLTLGSLLTTALRSSNGADGNASPSGHPPRHWEQLLLQPSRAEKVTL